MNKNTRSAAFLAAMGIMCLAMYFVYVNFQNDKPAILKQEQQNQVLTPGQMVQGVQNFINDTTSNLKSPPVNLPMAKGP